ncbi:DUF3561 family protein [Serratia sp. UGAL515B_01]|uniref:DUF3561 family protein n=1 Tax=Serratia sp. UGAL515B_01 TaxID=2986763 RepID=UPI0029548D3A|nr:DUF3561 family protein [Serratia sp. UGAL515B_01]WON76286.1 DUF3561 family protein [Serratia sp. UGAL515B_01]
MQNITPTCFDVQPEEDDPSYSFLGGVSGFVLYWLALLIPFILYGSNTLFFLLYTWPLFLALMPVSVILGVIISVLLHDRLIPTLFVTSASVIFLFWLVFRFLSGW